MFIWFCVWDRFCVWVASILIVFVRPVVLACLLFHWVVDCFVDDFWLDDRLDDEVDDVVGHDHPEQRCLVMVEEFQQCGWDDFDEEFDVWDVVGDEGEQVLQLGQWDVEQVQDVDVEDGDDQFEDGRDDQVVCRIMGEVGQRGVDVWFDLRCFMQVV